MYLKVRWAKPLHGRQRRFFKAAALKVLEQTLTRRIATLRDLVSQFGDAQ